jgi:DNA-directed RNA polymerase specialized sigma subunit
MSNYFNNDEVETAIKKFQTLNEKDPDNKDNIQVVYPYTEQFQQLVRGIINVHKIYRFHSDLEELLQEGMTALYMSLGRFDDSKGTAFNYLSFVVKNHLKNWTQNKNKKDWVTDEYNDSIYNHGNREVDMLVISDLLYSIEIEERLEPIIDDIVVILSRGDTGNKRDVIKSLTKKGWSRQDISDVYDKLEEVFNPEYE